MMNRKMVCVVVVVAAMAACAVAETQVFTDTYGIADGSNINADLLARQSGMLATIQYSESPADPNGTGWESQIFNTKLQLANNGSTGSGITLATLDRNLKGVLSGQVLGTHVNVQFKVNCTSNGARSYQYAAINFGSPLKASGQAGCFSIRMVDDQFGGYGRFFQIYDGTTLVGNLAGTFETTFNNLAIYLTSADNNWNPDGGEVWDGGKIALGILCNDTAIGSFGISNGYTDGYITLESSFDLGFTAPGNGLSVQRFDDLTVYATEAGAANLAWADGFTAGESSLDINLDYATRQSGPLAPKQFVANSSNQATDYHEQVLSDGTAGVLLLAGDVTYDPTTIEHSPILVSPNHNFKGISDGKVIGSTITFDLDIFTDDPNDSYAQAGITIGASSALTAAGTAGGGFGIRFVEDWFVTNSCFLQFYDGDTMVANLVANPAGTGWATVTIKVFDPQGGSPWDGVGSTAIDVYVNGQKVYGYEKTNGGYTNNYITLEGSRNLNGSLATNYFDNLRVWMEAAAAQQLQADLNGDFGVNLEDFSIFAQAWMATGQGIKNPSFENDIVADGTFVDIDGVPDLSGLSTNIPQQFMINPSIFGQIINPLDTDPIQPTDGNNLVFLSGGTGNLAQFVGGHCTQGSLVRIEPNTIYTVLVDVAVDSTWNPGIGDWYQVEINALHDNCPGYDGITTLVAKNHGTDAPAVNEWKTVALTLDTASYPTSADGNDFFLLALKGSGVYYDNFRFFATVFPDYDNNDLIDIDDLAVLVGEWLMGN